MQANNPLSPAQHAVLWFVRLYLLAALAWIAWGWINYNGVFRWVSRLQIDVMDEYSDKLSVIASFVLVAIPAGVISQVFGVDKLLLGRRPAGAPPVSQARIVGFVALAAFVVAVGGLVWAMVPHAPPTVGELDLRAGNQPLPPTDRVTITGFEQPRLTSTLVTTTSGHEDRTTYTPLTGPNWRRGDPVTFFVEAGQDGVIQVPRFDPGGMPIPIAGETRIEAGIVSRNALPGVLLDDYAKNGVHVADPHFVIESADASMSEYGGYIVAGIAGVFAFFLAFAALLMRLRARSLARKAEPHRAEL